MPLLTVHDSGESFQFDRLDEVRLGTDAAWSSVALPDGLAVAARHAVLARSAFNRLLMVIDLSAGQTWVNQHPVTRLRVLRQGDTLRMGHCALTVWEVQIARLKPGDPAIGQKCPVSRQRFQAGDEVIACPGCGAIHERAAWFLVERCAAGCGYPNRGVIIETLTGMLLVERDLDRESKLVERIENGQVLQDGARCQAGQARDQVPFQMGQHAVYCPSCQSPFHLECFLTLPACPVCGYDIDTVVRQAFWAGSHSAAE